MGKGVKADVAVVGAGIFGLSCAWSCAARGLRVVVLERQEVGAGAVGALSPHPRGRRANS